MILIFSSFHISIFQYSPFRGLKSPLLKRYKEFGGMGGKTYFCTIRQ